MSLTSYQAAPPRALRIVSMRMLRKSKNVCPPEIGPENGIAFAFETGATSLRCERENSCRHSELVGPRFCRALVSEKDAGGRAAPLVRAAFRFGRGELDILFSAGTANGGTLVRSHTG